MGEGTFFLKKQIEKIINKRFYNRTSILMVEGVPTEEPCCDIFYASDTTTGILYFWNGSAWAKYSTIDT